MQPAQRRQFFEFMIFKHDAVSDIPDKLRHELELRAERRLYTVAEPRPCKFVFTAWIFHGQNRIQHFWVNYFEYDPLCDIRMSTTRSCDRSKRFTQFRSLDLLGTILYQPRACAGPNDLPSVKLVTLPFNCLLQATKMIADDWVQTYTVWDRDIN